MQNKKVYIITGLSGSGKSTAIQAFEDACFYCVDNMPIKLVPKFLKLPIQERGDIRGIAFVMDMRSKTFLEDYAPGIQSIEDIGIHPQIIFLEASIDTLLKRFNCTRRHHPLSTGNSLLESIEAEMNLMRSIRLSVDIIIDTSAYNVHEFKSKILTLISRRKSIPDLMKLNVKSFGFKYGIPTDANLLIDVRFLSNPYFVPELKNQDGESQAVKDFVLSAPETKTFLKQYIELLNYLIPLYIQENKAYLTIAVGCTGGRHRSVVIAREIFEYLNNKGLCPGIAHRDIDRDLRQT